MVAVSGDVAVTDVRFSATGQQDSSHQSRKYFIAFRILHAFNLA